MKLSKLVASHFKIHWRLLTCFLVVWTVIATASLMLPLLSKHYSISSGDFYDEKISEISHSRRTVSSISIEFLYHLFFQGFGLVIYGFIIVAFINKILLKEVGSTQINIWFTQPVSRTQILLGKALFLIAVVSLMYAPALIVLLSVSAQAADVKYVFKNLVIGAFQNYIYLIFMTLVFFFIAVYFIEKVLLVNLIMNLIVIYSVLTGIGDLYLVLTHDNSNFLKIMVKKVGPQIFITEVFDYLNNDETTKIILTSVKTDYGRQELVYYMPVMKKLNPGLISGLNIGMIFIGGMFLAGTNEIFKRKSLNI